MNRLVWKGIRRRLLAVSNRLPIAIDSSGDSLEVNSGSGGLVTAMSPIIKNTEGVWVGWPGCELTSDVEQILDEYSQQNSLQLKPVGITDEEVRRYYRGFSNESIWPLFHDLLGHCKFKRENWDIYCRVNRKFAEKIVEIVRPGDLIWVHDYQLLMVAHYLRQMNIKHPLAFFLHIPFPTHDLLRRNPWMKDIIRGLLEYDLIGFQTLRDRRNFTRCAKENVPEIEINARSRYSNLHFGLRNITVGHFPISIDFDEFNERAKAADVAREAKNLREQCNATSLILGVDRLDYTKGIPERLRAFERALEKYPGLKGKLSLLQLVVPSRSHLDSYRNLKDILDGLVGRINGRFSSFGWTPVLYMYRSVSKTELLGFYQASEIALITPLRDGMNLVSKEYCASSADENGVLILSDFAGASDQLREAALVVNPYNTEQTADAIYKAYTMELRERQRRMRQLRSEIKRNDIFQWVDWFLSAFRDQRQEEPISAPRPYDTLPEDVAIVHRHLEPLQKTDE